MKVMTYLKKRALLSHADGGRIGLGMADEFQHLQGEFGNAAREDGGWSVEPRFRRAGVVEGQTMPRDPGLVSGSTHDIRYG